MATTLFWLFLLFTLLNILYYLGFFKFAFAKHEFSKKIQFPVSVIICAKNEEENLKNFIPSILNQNYSNFEIILINDASTDSSLEVMEDFKNQDPRIQIVNVQNNEAFWANKKYALTLGIKRAKNPCLLFIDADCAPQSTNWISHMASGFDKEKSIVLGYGGYFKHRKSFLNKIIRFETLLTAIQYFSYATHGSPYMGVGRNLAYTTAEFFKQNGFATHLRVKAGDDDLFVNQAATNTNTQIIFHEDSITRSVPKNTFKTWFTQKRRHVSVASYYKKKHQMLLGAFYFSQISFWILLIFLLIFQIHWQIVLAVLIIRLIVQLLVYFNAAKKFNEMDLVWVFPFLEIFLISSQFGIFIANLFSKPTSWK